MSVLAHLNQPLGSCYSYQEKMASIADELKQFHQRKKLQAEMVDSYPEDATTAEAQAAVNMREMEPDVCEADPVPLEKASYFIEEYEGAA
jgi:hypothetical protein